MNKRQQGELYRKNVLNLLARIGYASTRQIAKGVWGRCDTSTRKMAGRTLRRLLSDSLIVSKRDGVGVIKVNYELLYALTSAGAEEARRFGSPLIADRVHARQYLRRSHSHRSACNSVFVAWSNQTVWSELEIYAKRPPLHSFKFEYKNEENFKIPDLLAVTPERRWEWIEVENSWRSEKDLLKIRACVREMFKTQRSIGCVHFIVTVPGARTIGSRLAKLMTPENFDEFISGELDALILQNHIKVSLLNPETLTLTPIDWRNPTS